MLYFVYTKTSGSLQRTSQVAHAGGRKSTTDAAGLVGWFKYVFG